MMNWITTQGVPPGAYDPVPERGYKGSVFVSWGLFVKRGLLICPRLLVPAVGALSLSDGLTRLLFACSFFYCCVVFWVLFLPPVSCNMYWWHWEQYWSNE